MTVPLYDPPEPDDTDYVQTFGTGSISTLPTEDEETDEPAPRRLPFGFGVPYTAARNASVRTRHRNSVPRRMK